MKDDGLDNRHIHLRSEMRVLTAAEAFERTAPVNFERGSEELISQVSFDNAEVRGHWQIITNYSRFAISRMVRVGQQLGFGDDGDLVFDRFCLSGIAAIG